MELPGRCPPVRRPHRLHRAPKRLFVVYIFFTGTPAEPARVWPTYTGQMSDCLRSAGTRWRTQGYAIIRLPSRLLCHFGISDLVVTLLVSVPTRCHQLSTSLGNN